jgi:hypothetical protein
MTQMFELFRNGKTTGIIDLEDRQREFIGHMHRKYDHLRGGEVVRYTLKEKKYANQ